MSWADAILAACAVLHRLEARRTDSAPAPSSPSEREPPPAPGLDGAAFGALGPPVALPAPQPFAGPLETARAGLVRGSGTP